MNKEQLNREIIACLKEQQKEYKYGGNAYNVLRKLETLIPNIVNESLKGEGEKEHFMKCTICGEKFDKRDFGQVMAHEHTDKKLHISRTGKRIAPKG